MNKEIRLAKVERHLSPRQLVTMDVLESRRKYRSFVHDGQAMARSGIPRPTLMDRIATSVTATTPGVDRSLRHRLIREAQREGLFLARLSNEVSVQVGEEERELGLMTALLSTQLALMMSQSELPNDDQMEAWLTAAVGHRRRLLCIHRAVARVEDAYFDGAKLLYSESAECLTANLERIEDVLAMAVGPRDGRRRRRAEPGMDFRELGPTNAEVDQDSEELATAWMTNTQAVVAAEFGEDAHAVRLLATILLKD